MLTESRFTFEQYIGFALMAGVFTMMLFIMTLVIQDKHNRVACLEKTQFRPAAEVLLICGVKP